MDESQSFSRPRSRFGLVGGSSIVVERDLVLRAGPMRPRAPPVAACLLTTTCCGRDS